MHHLTSIYSKVNRLIWHFVHSKISKGVSYCSKMLTLGQYLSETIKLWTPPVCSVATYFFLSIFKIYLAVVGLCCGMWDLIPCLGIEPEPLVLGAQNLNHWTTREVPASLFLGIS